MSGAKRLCMLGVLVSFGFFLSILVAKDAVIHADSTELRILINGEMADKTITPDRNEIELRIDPTEHLQSSSESYQLDLPEGITVDFSKGNNRHYENQLRYSKEKHLLSFTMDTGTIDLILSVDPNIPSIGTLVAKSASSLEIVSNSLNISMENLTDTSNSEKGVATLSTSSSISLQDETVADPPESKYHSVLFISEGTQVEPKEVEEGKLIVAPDPPTRSGYDFSHWSLREGGTAYHFADPVTKDLILYAVWKPKQTQYSVAFALEKPNIQGDPGLDHDNYTVIGHVLQQGISEEKVTITSEIAEKMIAENEGLQANLFASEFAFSDQQVSISGNGSTTVYVYYKRICYDVTFDLNLKDLLYQSSTNTQASMTIGKKSYVNQLYHFQAKYMQDLSDHWPEDVYTDGNVGFSGWIRQPEQYFPEMTISSKKTIFGKELIPNDPKVRSVTLSAKWTSNLTKVKFNRYFETNDKDQSDITKDGKYYKKTVLISYIQQGNTVYPTPEVGYEAQDTKGSYIEQGVTTYDYYYDLKTYQLKFDYGNQILNEENKLNRTISLKYGEKIPEPKRPERVGYTFEGWFSNAYFDEPIKFSEAVMPASNVVYYAKWQGNSYTVTYLDKSNGNILATQTYGKGDYVTFPKEFVEGKAFSEELGIFKGWYYALSHGSFKFSTTVPVTSDMTLFATWAKNRSDPADPYKPVDPAKTSENPGTGNTGELRIDYVPTGFEFGKVHVKTVDQEIAATPTLSTEGKPIPQWVQVSDVRDHATGWQVKAKAETAFTASDGSILAGVSIILPKGKAYNAFFTDEVIEGLETKRAEIIPGTDTEVPIFLAAAESGKDISTDVWEANDVKLKIPRNTGHSHKRYQTTINWNLVTNPND